ncbi:MAG: FxsA family protein, partial [Pseudomonadota bacterium]|nr:FxsA family protein [Pseudomonadota bacterium]
RMTVSGQNHGRSFFFSAGGGAGPFGQGPFGQQRPFDRDSNGNIIEGEYQDQTRTDRGQLQQGQFDQDEQEKK